MIYNLWHTLFTFLNRQKLNLQPSSAVATRKLSRRLPNLLIELQEHPRTGTGQVEHLKHFVYEETWSRRINKQYRMIYEIHDLEIYVSVVSLRSHYVDKWIHFLILSFLFSTLVPTLSLTTKGSRAFPYKVHEPYNVPSEARLKVVLRSPNRLNHHWENKGTDMLPFSISPSFPDSDHSWWWCWGHWVVRSNVSCSCFYVSHHHQE